MALVGISPGKRFAPEALGPEARNAFEDGVASAKAKLAAMEGRIGAAGKNGWSGGGTKVGRYGTDYATRAAVARIGLGALPPEDATYMHCHQDKEGQPLNGSYHYRIHFDKGQLPPVRAFWSVTMDSKDGYFLANPIRRFAIGDRDPLKFNDDGSLDLYIQRTAPGGERDFNWLPAPENEFNLSLRLYWPNEDVLSGTWSPPAVVREE
jgi:hypothetical protein